MYKETINQIYENLSHKKSLKIYSHTHIHTHLCEFVDNTHFLSEKQVRRLYLKQKDNILFKSRSSYESSLIFIKSFLYLIDSPLSIALIFF